MIVFDPSYLGLVLSLRSVEFSSGLVVRKLLPVFFKENLRSATVSVYPTFQTSEYENLKILTLKLSCIKQVHMYVHNIETVKGESNRFRKRNF